MYDDFLGREIEDLEMDNMRRDSAESDIDPQEALNVLLDELNQEPEWISRGTDQYREKWRAKLELVMVAQLVRIADVLENWYKNGIPVGKFG